MQKNKQQEAEGLVSVTLEDLSKVSGGGGYRRRSRRRGRGTGRSAN